MSSRWASSRSGSSPTRRREMRTASCQRAGRFGVRGQALQHVAEAAAVRLAGVVDPLRVESRQQLAVAQIDGLLQAPFPDEPLELPGVDADARRRRARPCRASPRGRPRPPRRARAGQRRARCAGSCARSSRARRARSDRRPPSAGACPDEERASRAASMPAGARASAMRLLPTRARRRRTAARGAWRTGYLRPIDSSRLIWPVKRLRSCGVRVALGWQGRVANDGRRLMSDGCDHRRDAGRVRARGHAARGVLVRGAVSRAGSARTPTAARATRSTPTTSIAARSAAST